MSDDDTQVYNIDQATIERQNMETKDAKIRKNQVLNLVPDKGNFTKNLSLKRLLVVEFNFTENSNF